MPSVSQANNQQDTAQDNVEQNELLALARFFSDDNETPTLTFRDIFMSEETPHRLDLIGQALRDAAYVDDVAYRFSCLLDHATGGRLSKTNYDKETMYTHVDDHVNKMVEQAREDDADEVAKEALADVKTHRANWRKAIEIALQASPTPTDESDDAQYWKHELAVFDRTFDGLTAAIASVQMEVGRRFTVEEMNKIVERKVAEHLRALT